MSLAFSLQTVFEFFMFIAVIWGIFNEQKLVSFERRLAALVRRRRLKLVKSDMSCRVGLRQQ